ncbi:peptidase inhibitor family I36 [Prauserella shujinwangii]|uniref:Peptidase inhibitor family I36 n=1 Tax=Prauserella shujinwangii TaxID=1453103 RepID=A0A2T0LXB6_9PSEU|nr:peptidase inhibitor family I36 protein [Prauserella shujinwangii]PRX48664.1 peptidase inhibitor family I36 [Prauserella shujinwangii]
MYRTDRAFRSRLSRVLLLATVGLLGGAGAAQAEPAGAGGQPPEFACAKGEFCTWNEEFYNSSITRFDLRNTNPGECVPLPDGAEGHSFANRIDRHVTVYQDVHCATEGDFSTYPGPGTFVPQAQFVVRAIQIWD